MNITKHLNKFTNEHNRFVIDLSVDLKLAGNETRTIHILNSVMHTLRDRISLQHSLHLISSLPAFLKLYYIDGWKGRSKPLLVGSATLFYVAVDKELERLGEPVNKPMSTAEMVNKVLRALSPFIDPNLMKKIFEGLPPKLYSPRNVKPVLK